MGGWTPPYRTTDVMSEIWTYSVMWRGIVLARGAFSNCAGLRKLSAECRWVGL